MSKFNIGDPVIMVEYDEIRRGVVYQIFGDLPTMLVKFDDGIVGKVHVDKVALEPKGEVKSETKAQVEKTPIEKPEITITPDEFHKIAIETVIKESRDNMSIGFAFAKFSAKLHAALFLNEDYNV